MRPRLNTEDRAVKDKRKMKHTGGQTHRRVKRTQARGMLGRADGEAWQSTVRFSRTPALLPIRKTRIMRAPEALGGRRMGTLTGVQEGERCVVYLGVWEGEERMVYLECGGERDAWCTWSVGGREIRP